MRFRERAPDDPVTVANPGFFRVRPGTLVEPGDQLMDSNGDIQPCALEQVGRIVTADLVVLRIDRRWPFGEEAKPPPRPRGVPGP